jgi:hypothetical protein
MNETHDRVVIAGMLMKLFDHWQLETVEQLHLLGLSPNSRSALSRYRKGGALSNNRDLLDRAGLLLGIHKSLRMFFPSDRKLAYAWMKTPNKEFRENTPVEVVVEYGFEGLLMVRAYLDKACN